MRLVAPQKFLHNRGQKMTKIRSADDLVLNSQAKNSPFVPGADRIQKFHFLRHKKRRFDHKTKSDRVPSGSPLRWTSRACFSRNWACFLEYRPRFGRRFFEDFLKIGRGCFFKKTGQVGSPSRSCRFGLCSFSSANWFISSNTRSCCWAVRCSSARRCSFPTPFSNKIEL